MKTLSGNASYDISKNGYLPCGIGGRNDAPSMSGNPLPFFIFLRAKVDWGLISPGTTKIVYIPCYWEDQ